MRGGIVNRSLPLIQLGGIVLMLATAGVLAAEEGNRSGGYVGFEIGLSKSSNVDTTLSGVSHETRCDRLLYADPNDAPTDERCTDNTPRRLFGNKFSLGTGFVGGVTLGYAYGNFRFEGEYQYRHQGGDRQLVVGSRSNEALATKDSEWSQDIPPTNRLSDYEVHQFFANVYYDFLNSSAWTPYLGAGIGIARIEMDYDNLFVRKTDLGTEEWQRAAADTQSSMDVGLEETQFAYQIMGGVDYALTERVSIGMKGRWTRLDGFTKKSRKWNQIRSHKPVQADGTTPFTSEIKVDDIDHWTVTVGLKYRF